MSRMIFINLPVADLHRSIAFYEALGAVKNKDFCDDTTAACMVLSDSIHVMLLTHAKFQTFTPKKIADAKVVSEVLLCLSADSRTTVDEMVEKAAAAGGIKDPVPKEEHGFMYGRSFEDLDGHIWESMWLDMDAVRAMRAEGVGA
ncbi:VOC family protein [Telmatospirillum sp. J64-1]|uniref:VOC family protein n=1 Tax=Telmatospirillum sp. J64-1 TaxID=2502183 RepID=UPI00115F6103|nr:VOC family protein [Telmatospirillum sp. J64-1]